MIVTMDYWFENILFYELVREELGLHDLGVIKTVKEVTPKNDLTNILESKMVPWGTHVVYGHTNSEGETYFMVAWKFKSNCVKGKKQNNNLITTMIFTN